jgi:hypothetical protein
VGRLEEIGRLLEEVGNPWPQAAHGVLHDPERLDEAEALLSSARERARSFPAIGPGPGLDGVSGSMAQLVVRAADQLVNTDRPEYNPLYVWNEDGSVARRLLEASGRSYQAVNEEARVAFISVSDFAEEFIEALSRGVAGAWRERWWSAELLLVHGAQDLSSTERAQDEFFHLFEALQRRKARIMVAADRPPAKIQKIDERLRSRFEGGLVLEVQDLRGGEGRGPGVGAARPDEVSRAGRPSGGSGPHSHGPKAEEEKDVSALDREWIMGFSSRPEAHAAVNFQHQGLDENEVFATGDAEGGLEAWFPSPERVIWEWPRIEDRVVEDPD